VVEFVVTGLFAAVGVFSLLHWLNVEFGAASPAEHIAFAMYATGRVGMWFAFAGFFLGYAIVDEPQAFRWYILLPIVLAGVQLLSGLYLGRSSSSAHRRSGRLRGRDDGED
jgi:hypothetical protein